MSAMTNSVAPEPFAESFVYGLSRPTESLNGIVSQIARMRTPVLIVGESGVGKDSDARLIQHLSFRGGPRLRKINCAAPNPSLFFNTVHEANCSILSPDPGSTLYLEQLHELDFASQRMLYSDLMEAESAKGQVVRGARLISSSIRTLENGVASERLSRKLYFQVNGVCLRLPPLRERRDDIPIRMEYFLGKHFSAAKKRFRLSIGGRSIRMCPTIGGATFESWKTRHSKLSPLGMSRRDCMTVSRRNLRMGLCGKESRLSR